MSPGTTTTKPLALYVRVSRTSGRDVTAEGGTAQVQEERCRAQAAASGYTVGEVFTQPWRSGIRSPGRIGCR